MLTSFRKVSKRFSDFMARRPHRSFRLTRRRDYIRPIDLPGNISFTFEVSRLLWIHRKTFLLLVLVYVVFYGLLVGIQSQDSYSEMSDLLREAGGDLFSGNWGAVTQAGVLFLGIASSNVNGATTEMQQFFSVFIFLLAWLSTVWILRNILAGRKVKLRDGLYNSGAPIISTAIIALLIIIQLLPAAIAVIGYSAASSTGMLDGGAATMLFWLAAGLLGVLSMYWITSSLFAMIIVTLPGTYPYQAVKAAGDIVIGRRVKLLLRWLWMVMVVGLAMLLAMLPVILLDMGIKNLWPDIEWLPIVPVVLLIYAGFAAVWVAAYVYLLYRKIVDYAPAN